MRFTRHSTGTFSKYSFAEDFDLNDVKQLSSIFTHIYRYHVALRATLPQNAFYRSELTQKVDILVIEEKFFEN